MNTITVSILPQKYFVEKIAGPEFTVNVLIPPGASPATYEPTPRQIMALGNSAVYFRIGHIPFEKAWVKKVAAANPKMKIVDTSRGVKLIRGGHHHGEPGHEGHHHGHVEAETGIDPHIWLSPSSVKVQLNHILSALSDLAPGHKVVFEKNHWLLTSRLDSLDKEIRSTLAGAAGQKFLAFHPAWTYFAAEYGLEQVPIEEEGKSPGPASLKKVIDAANKENIKVIFVQQQFDTNSADAIAKEIGGKVVQLDPLAEDWLDNMRKIAAAFKLALGAKQVSPGRF